MKKRIAILAGDGVGPEVVDQGVRVLTTVAKKFGHEFELKEGLIGAVAIEKTGNPLPEETLELCKSSDAILFGAIGDPKYDNDPNAPVRPEQGLLKLRKELGLFANLRPVHVYSELAEVSPLKVERVEKVDLVVVRELIGGIYFGEKKRIGNRASDLSEYSKAQIDRVARVAFDLAMKRKKKVTSVDKANVLETSRLWRETVGEVGKNYPKVELSHMFVDNAAMQIIKRPSEFDVILTENMFGDILTDEASVLAGSIGLLPSASFGESVGLYEPIHGAFNKAAGKNIANPVGTILSVAMMLRISFGLEKEAITVEQAVEKMIKQGWRTRDIATKEIDDKKIIGTKEIGEKICAELK
ncbi:3-isopropylmalate dehydrogenase [Candidatus Gottesmanbacteria bacterium]|nr:3-isopropylmalate dehydrogenase [Candidatus Gottesmanbacteria bacterium]